MNTIILSLIRLDGLIIYFIFVLFEYFPIFENSIPFMVCICFCTVCCMF